MDASHEWQPSGLVTWTTDFGLENGFVGTMRGVLLARAPQATWVDLTHGIPAQALDVAAIELRSALPYFAPGSLHVVVVDPGVGTERRVLCGVHGGQCVLGPDNGILPAVLGPGAGYFVLPEAPWTLSSPSRTFHGRDVFAPLAAALLTGELRPAEEEPCADPVRLDASSPVPEGSGRHSLRVQLVDRFGNLVTNWQVAENGVPAPGSHVRSGAMEIPLLATYGEVARGACVALVNSWGYLEIAVRDGNASRKLGLERGDPVQLQEPQ